jgi:hypothetical protein
MDAVDAKLLHGLQKVKDAIATLTKAVRPNANTEALESAEIFLSIDWKTVQMALGPATRLTAYARYQLWYKAVFRGTKRAIPSDDEYVPVDEEENGSSSGNLDELSRRNSRSSTMTRGGASGSTNARKSRRVQD